MRRYVAVILLGLIAIVITGALSIIVGIKSGLAFVFESGLFKTSLLAIALAMVTGLIFDLIMLNTDSNSKKNDLKTSILYWGLVTLASRIYTIFQTGMINDFSLSLIISILVGMLILFGTGCIFGFFFWRMYTSTFDMLNKA